ncbi:hypothetical protein CEK62_05510 [Alcanivorax sp. N3-2A]|nr:hypothetical protein CEK62_05510 [Alcanivorax sp. N3-2A]
MADSLLYLINQPPGGDAGWREAVEMALTGAAFGQPTVVWLQRVPMLTLSRRADAAELIAELAGFGVRCVADDGLDVTVPGVEALQPEALSALRAEAAQVVVL